MLVKSNHRQVLRLLMSRTSFLRDHRRRLECWVYLDTEQFAHALRVLIEFALWFEGLEVETVCLNGLILAEGPDFLHFVLII